MATNTTSFEDLIAFLEALERSPAATEAARYLDLAPLIVERVLVAMLSPARDAEAAADADAWYVECVEVAWGG